MSRRPWRGSSVRWDGFKGMDDEERERTIAGAYKKAHGKAASERIDKVVALLPPVRTPARKTKYR